VVAVAVVAIAKALPCNMAVSLVSVDVSSPMVGLMRWQISLRRCECAHHE
jgi:hypothetical protein